MTVSLPTRAFSFEEVRRNFRRVSNCRYFNFIQMYRWLLFSKIPKIAVQALFVLLPRPVCCLRFRVIYSREQHCRGPAFTGPASALYSSVQSAFGSEAVNGKGNVTKGEKSHILILHPVSVVECRRSPKTMPSWHVTGSGPPATPGFGLPWECILLGAQMQRAGRAGLNLCRSS